MKTADALTNVAKGVSSVETLAVAINGLSAASAANVLIQNQQALGTERLSLAQLQEALTLAGMTAEEAANTAATVVNTAAKSSNTAATAASGGAQLSATTKWAAFTTAIKANTASLVSTVGGFLSANAAILGVGAGIAVLSAALIYLNGATERQEQKVIELNEAYERSKGELEAINEQLGTTKERIEELSSGEPLTFVEQGELERLREVTQELMIQQKIKEEDANKAEIKAAEAARDAFQNRQGVQGTGLAVDFGEEGFTAALKSMSEDQSYFLAAQDGNILDLYASYLQLKKLIFENNRAIVDADEVSQQYYQNRVESLNEDLNTVKRNMREEALELLAQRDLITGMSSDKNRIKVFGADWEDQVKDFEYAVDRIQQLIDPSQWKQVQFDRIINDESLVETKTSLEELARTGQLTAETLASPEWQDFTLMMWQLGITSADVIAQFRALASTAVAATNSMTPFLSTISSLDNALQQQSTGGFITAEAYNALISSNEKWGEAITVVDGKLVANIDTLTGYRNELVNTTIQQQILAGGSEEVISALAGMFDQGERLTGAAEMVSEAYGVLNTVLKDQAESLENNGEAGEISAQTAANLISTNADLAQYIEVVNGALVFNTEAFYANARAQVQAQITAAQTDLSKLVAQYEGLGIAANSSAAQVFGLAGAIAASKAAIAGKVTEISDLEKLMGSFVMPPITTGGGGGGSAKKEVDLNLEEYERLYDDLEHLRNMDLISEEDYFAERERLNEKYLANNDDYLDKYRKNLEDLHKYRKQLLQDQKDDYDTAAGAVNNLVSIQITALQAEKDAIQDRKKEREAENEAREDAIKLAELEMAVEAQRRAQTIRIYREGQGFIYEADQVAIREAEKALEEARLEIEDKRLQDAFDAEIAAIDKQIDAWNDYKDQWSDVADAYEREQDRLIAEQVLGKDWEAAILGQRIDTLQKFADEYNALMASIQAAEAPTTSTTPTGNATTAYVAQKSASTTTQTKTADIGVSGKTSIVVNNATVALDPGRQKLTPYASGTTSSKQGGALVDEKSAEIILGGKRSGRYTYLERDSTVIDGESTKTLLNFAKNPISFIKDAISGMQLPNLASSSAQPIMVSVGDIVVQGAQNPESLAQATYQRFGSILAQAISRRGV